MSFQYSWQQQIFNKFCQWLDLNCGTTAQLCLVFCNALNLLWKKLIDLNANKEKTKLMIIQKKKLQLQIHFSSSFRFNAFKVNYSSFITVAFSLFSIPRYTSLKLPRSIGGVTPLQAVQLPIWGPCYQAITTRIVLFKKSTTLESYSCFITWSAAHIFQLNLTCSFY